MRIQENLENQNMRQMEAYKFKEQPFLIIQFVKTISSWMKKTIQSHPYLVMPILEVIFKTIQNVPSYLFIMAVQDVQVFGFTWDCLVLEL